MPMKRFSQGVAPGEGEEEEGDPWERTVEEDTGGEDWCGRRGCRTKTG